MDDSMDLFDDSDNQQEPDEESGEGTSGSDVLEGLQDPVEMKNNASPKSSSLECPFCFVTFNDLVTLQTHIDSHDRTVADDSVILVDDQHCDDDTGQQSQKVDVQSGDIYANTTIIPIEEPLPAKKGTFICPYCEVSLSFKEDLAQHLFVMHKQLGYKDLEELLQSLGLILCPLCRTFVCSTSWDMEKHVNGSHVFGSTLYPVVHDELQTDHSVSLGSCPVCGLSEPDADEMSLHVNSHFAATDDNPSIPSTSEQHSSNHFPAVKNSQSSSSSSSSSSHKLSKTSSLTRGKRRGADVYQVQYKKNLEKAVMSGKLSPGEYHEQIVKLNENGLVGMDDGQSRVKGMVEAFSSFYENHARPNQGYFLCHPTDYYCGSYGDKGWGCGYRNFQMLLSCLKRIPLYAGKLSPGNQVNSIPSVPKIQEMIEKAWQHGFDLEGCLQLEAKLVNTNKWIGATEIVATLSFLGIKCQLIDFPRCSADDGTHPLMFQWVQDYFTDNENQKPPLYLQHQGHSRTIVGVERDKNVTRLLLFDPGSSFERIAAQKLNLRNWKQMSEFRKGISAFKAKQYQIVAVVGLLTGNEYERAKKLTSTTII